MRNWFLMILAVAPVVVSAGTVTLGGASDGDVKFNGNPGELTLGSGNCPPCDLTGTTTGVAGLDSVTWDFTQPSATPFTYGTYVGLNIDISTSGTPSLLFSATDGQGDIATGTFALTMLGPDSAIGGVDYTGGTGIDIYGTISLTNFTAGGDSTEFAAFENVLSAPLGFVLDVGSCTTAGQGNTTVSVTPRCISQSSLKVGTSDDSGDPTGQAVQLQLTNGASSTPEPATFGLLGCGLAIAFAVRRRISQS